MAAQLTSTSRNPPLHQGGGSWGPTGTDMELGGTPLGLCPAVLHAARRSTVWTVLTLTPFPPGALDLGLLSRRLCPRSRLELWACGRVRAHEPTRTRLIFIARGCAAGLPHMGLPAPRRLRQHEGRTGTGTAAGLSGDEDAFTEAVLVGTAAGGLLAGSWSWETKDLILGRKEPASGRLAWAHGGRGEPP